MKTLNNLSGEISGGRRVPSNICVLSIKYNPEQEWFDLRQAAIMDRLNGRNQALMRRPKELEESGAKKHPYRRSKKYRTGSTRELGTCEQGEDVIGRYGEAERETTAETTTGILTKPY